MATDVKLIKHHLKNGKISLYLSYYPYFYDMRTHKTIKSENLKLWLIANPKNTTERKHNAEIEELAFAIQSKRIIQIRNEEFGFLDKTRRDEDFLKYFQDECMKHHSKWDGCYKQFYKFCGGTCTFGMLNVDMCKQFREHLLHGSRNRRTGKLISRNSASGYFGSFRSILKKAYIDKMLECNLNDYFDGISATKTHKEYLTLEEFRTLAATPCKYDVLRRIAIFAVFCGMRISDLESLQWEQIVQAPDGGWCIRKQIVKTQRWESIFISEEALSYCGPRETGLVFKGFRRCMIAAPFKEWIKEAGISKYITFHCLRHTNATLMLEGNIDIYTVSHQLTHLNVQTTQIYAEVVDAKKREASNAITLK